MAVPTHDQRDFEFAKRYNLPMRVVIQNMDGTLSVETLSDAYVEDGRLVNSGQFSLPKSDVPRAATTDIQRNMITVAFVRTWN